MGFFSNRAARLGPMGGMPDPFDPEEMAKADFKRSRRAGNATVGTLEELKALAETPEDLQRIHMSPDGKYYLPDVSDGMGQLTQNFDLQNAKTKATLASLGGRAGSEMSRRNAINNAKHGFDFGAMWSDVEDLNRGREATGFGAKHIPGANLAAAVPQAAAMQQGLNNAYAQRAGAAAANPASYTNMRPEAEPAMPATPAFNRQPGIQQIMRESADAGLRRAANAPPRMQSFSGGRRF